MIHLFDLAKNARKNSFDVLDALIYRWSPRSMNGADLSVDVLQPLFDAARYAPSAFNEQPERFYVASRKSASFVALSQLLAPQNQEWCKNASFLIVLVSKATHAHNGKINRTHSFDTGAAWAQFAIEGVKRNLVVHGMSGFDYDKTKMYLGVSDDFQVECMIAVGAPTDAVTQEQISTRQPLEEIVTVLS